MIVETAQPLIFLSWSHADAEIVKHLKTDLQDQGINIWTDWEGLEPGTPDWEEDLRTAIRRANAVLLVASPNARTSRYVKDELRIAEMYRRPVYPIWVAGNQWMEVVPIGWGGVQHIDAREGRYKKALPEIVAALGKLPMTSHTLPTPDFEPRNPYKGLRAFTDEDAHDFFGRERLIDEIIDVLGKSLTVQKKSKQNARLLAIVGPSGSGKSSLVMAGLLPHLQAGGLSGSNEWLYLGPIVPGSHPFESLTLALSEHLSHKSFKVIREDLEDDSARGLHLLATSLTKRQGTNVVLFVDQFEELFTQTTDEDERRLFIEVLVAAMTEPRGPVIVILTLRADFYDRPMNYPELGGLIEAHHRLVLPMEMKDLRAVIEKPAALPDVQLTFEDDLVGDLLFEVQGQAGALPLLQFTLEQLFEQRREHLLTLQAYHQVGGAKGALAQHAEAIYNALPSVDHRQLARVLFLRLIDPGATEQDTTRRRAALTELSLPDPAQTTMLRETADAFIAARLLTTNTIAGTPTLEVSHEALIREWARLADWLITNRNDILLQKAISEDAARWIRYDKSTDRLYRGNQLVEALGWAERNTPSVDEVAFLEASKEEREREEAEKLAQQARELELQRRVARRQRYVIGMMGIASLILVGALIVTLVLTTTLQMTVSDLQSSALANVTNLNDHGPGSLRDAINKAKNGDVIRFARNVTGTILLTSGELNIDKSLIITGPGVSVLSISGGDTDRVFVVSSGAAVTISNMTIEHGHSVNPFDNIYDGGGIYNAGTLALINSTLSGNMTNNNGGGIANEEGGILTLTNTSVSSNRAGTDGGGIFNDSQSTLTLTGSTISGNTSPFGGGIFNDSQSTLTLTGSTISGNTSVLGGGGISNSGQSMLTLTGSTISGNTSTYSGGGISNGGQSMLTLTGSTISGNIGGNGGGIDMVNSYLTLSDSTISGNTSTGGGGGIFINELSKVSLDFSTIYGNTATGDYGGGILALGNLVMMSSIVAGNNAYKSQDVFGTVTLSSVNLIQNISNVNIIFDNPDHDCGYSMRSIFGKSPDLGPLKDNGGFTQTQALLSGSPAIDLIPNGINCGTFGQSPITTPTCPVTDQRGMQRPDEGEDFCDIGAYEYQS